MKEDERERLNEKRRLFLSYFPLSERSGIANDFLHASSVEQVLDYARWLIRTYPYNNRSGRHATLLGIPIEIVSGYWEWVVWWKSDPEEKAEEKEAREKYCRELNARKKAAYFNGMRERLNGFKKTVGD